MEHTILEQNKKIAIFDGFKPTYGVPRSEKPEYEVYTKKIEGKEFTGAIYPNSNDCYHSSWNLQVPIWGKVCVLSQALSNRSKKDYHRHLDMISDYMAAIRNNDTLKGLEIISRFIDYYNKKD